MVPSLFVSRLSLVIRYYRTQKLEPYRFQFRNSVVFSSLRHLRDRLQVSNLSCCGSYGGIRAQNFHFTKRTRFSCLHRDNQSLPNDDDREQGPLQEEVLKAILDLQSRSEEERLQ